jgi:opacity protein-like surface antigen
MKRITSLVAVIVVLVVGAGSAQAADAANNEIAVEAITICHEGF